MFNNFRSTRSYKILSTISLIEFPFILNIPKLEMLAILVVPIWWIMNCIIFSIGVLMAFIEQERITSEKPVILLDIGFIVGCLIILSPALFIFTFIILDIIDKIN